MSTIYIGSARIDEDGNSTGGEAGDQTGKEVSTQTFYTHSKGWYIIRPTSVTHANKLAERMQAACDNDNIGYDQNNRLGIITYGIDTTTATECDCSSLVRECVIEATGDDPGNFTTSNEVTKLEATGLFEEKEAFTSQSATPVYNGDILVTKTSGHTVIVVSGNKRSLSSSSSSSSSSGLTTIKEIQNWVGTTADGIYGTKTKKAIVKKVQGAIGVTQDGIFGTKSKAAWSTLKKGSDGTAVKCCQCMLICLGYSCGSYGADGDFGSKTYSAVKKFQKAESLDVDGIIGKNTAYALFG